MDYGQIVTVNSINNARPYVQRVQTTTATYVFKFEEGAEQSVYNRAVLADLGMPVVNMALADDATRHELNVQELFPQFKEKQLLIMPLVEARDFRSIEKEKNAKKLFKNFSDDYLVSTIVTNSFDLNAENVFEPNTVIDTRRGLFHERHSVIPVDKMYHFLTHNQITFPHFYGYNDRSAMAEASKRLEKKLDGYKTRVPAEFHETYAEISERGKEFKSFVKNIKCNAKIFC